MSLGVLISLKTRRRLECGLVFTRSHSRAVFLPIAFFRCCCLTDIFISHKMSRFAVIADVLANLGNGIESKNLSSFVCRGLGRLRWIVCGFKAFKANRMGQRCSVFIIFIIGISIVSHGRLVMLRFRLVFRIMISFLNFYNICE